MDATTVTLIKMMSDIAMTAMKTISEVHNMTDEQKITKITEAEVMSDILIRDIKERAANDNQKPV